MKFQSSRVVVLSRIFFVKAAFFWIFADAQDTCRDVLSTQQCATLAISGRCTLAREEMLATCPLTCRFCFPNGEPPCEDVNSAFCSEFVVVGVCNQFRDFLHRACRLSCGFCTPKGNWGEWTNWGRCTATCGVGSSVRTRRCSTGRDQDCAVQRNRDARFCNTQDCPAGGVLVRLSQWTTWSRCSRTCGSGVSVRNRRCISRITGLRVIHCSAATRNERSCFITRCPVRVVYTWNRWTPWGPCTRTCESGTQVRRRTCNVSPSRNCGTSRTDFQTCNDFPCPRVISWNQWSAWSSCTRLCNIGTRTRTRTCSTGRTIDCGPLSTFTEQCSFRRCAVVAWLQWGTWGACSRPCGVGFRTRSRLCITGLTTDCGSSSEDSQQCNFQSCPPASWLSWNSWSSCSRTCGEGTESRKRRCSTFRRSDCPARTLATDTRTCNLQRCPTRAQPAWNSWRSWRACSDPCGGGVRVRVRVCSSGRRSDCGSDNRQTEPCNIHECPEINWNPWNAYEPCTRSCGDGTRTRSRTCNSGKTTDCGVTREAIMTTPCNTESCPSSFKWNEWTQWTQCTKSCNGGTQERSRTCPTGTNNDCGTLFYQNWLCNSQPCRSGTWNSWNAWSDCSTTCNTGRRSRTRSCSSGRNSDCGSNRRQIVNCNTNRCTRSSWNRWSAWSACSASCGQEGTRRRTRTCGTGRNADCGSVTRRMANCNRRECLTWNSWNSWSPCSATCGPGTRLRTRECNSANNRNCQGRARQRGDCNARRCPPATWNAWSSWSQCSKSCENGTRNRRRTCSTGTVADCGSPARQASPCNTQDCPLPATWNNWSSWSACSRTCDEGSSVRLRTCSTGIDLDCGLSPRQTLPCNTQVCPTVPTWETWSSWSACDRTCGGGATARTRSCSTGNIIDCGVASRESLPCSEELCPVVITEPSWNNWGSWSSCSRSCGNGLSSSRRSCSTTNDLDCDGQATKSRRCNTDPCPKVYAWNSWGSLTPCSRTCGRGTTSRTRTCNSRNLSDCGTTSIQTFVCNTTACPLAPGSWTSWESWSTCDKTCGPGRRFRVRRCEGMRSCFGQTLEIEECSIKPCSEVCRCANEACQDDTGGDCDVFSPYCADIPTYAESRCRRTCGLCPDQPLRDRCQCDDVYRVVCPLGQTLRYNSSDCCTVNYNKTCGLNTLRSRAINTPKSSIVYGEIATQERWPWMAYLQSPIGVCGGSLISSRWIVSAAHCLANQLPSNIMVRLGGGKENLTIASRTYVALSVLLHPLFRINAAQNLVENDIALVQLPEEVSINSVYKHPICLPLGEVPPIGFECFVAGWEATSQVTEAIVPTLRQLKVQIVSNFACRRVHSFLRDYMICAGETKEEMEACRGDSGGPLMCQMCRSCEWHLIGIISFGPNRCGTVREPGVYTRVSSFEDWITQNTGINAGLERDSMCF